MASSRLSIRDRLVDVPQNQRNSGVGRIAMKLITDFEDRFLECLASLELDEPRIQVYPASIGKYKYFGAIISKTFEGMNEAARQRLVWQRILDTLDDSDQRRVEFVYTNSPSERPDEPY
jgi:stress-induced morphogen